MTKLVYFTASFPYGVGENWKYTEIEVLNRYFDEILVVPLDCSGNARKRVLPSTVRILKALFISEGQRFSKQDILRLANKRFLYHLTALLRMTSCKKIIPDIKNWAVNALKIERILTNQYFRDYILPELNDSTLYFFWGKGYADILPFLDKSLQKHSVVRMHGFDLYWERSGSFIPYQSLIVHAARYILTVSKHGTCYIKNAYPKCATKVIHSSLGTLSKGQAAPSNDKVLRIVSCAFVSEVKRLHIIASALQFIKMDVHWTHIGSGDQLKDLVRLTETLGVTGNVTFTGNIPAGSVAEYYSSNEFDLYLNVSSSEGMPVSIMEAFAAGIPVLATDVGGNSEIVDEEVGWLLPEKLDAVTLAQNIEKFRDLDGVVKKHMRVACYNKYKEHYDAVRNAEKLSEILQSV